MRHATSLLFVLATLALALPAAGQAPEEEPPPAPSGSPFDRTFALGVYGTGWLGAYGAGGIGGRLRWEPYEWLGVEVFGEALAVEWPGAFRHDWPVGFNLYVPIAITRELRLRPLFGFCAVFSLIEPPANHAPRADDILFGIHGGLGLEYALLDWLSAFVDVQAVGWVGHDRASSGWSADIEDSYTTFGVAQLTLGVTAHFGD